MIHKLKELDLIAQGFEKTSETPEHRLYTRGLERVLLYNDGREIRYNVRNLYDESLGFR